MLTGSKDQGDEKALRRKKEIAQRRQYSKCGLEKRYSANNRKTKVNCKKDGNEDHERKIWSKGMKRKKSNTSP